MKDGKKVRVTTSELLQDYHSEEFIKKLLDELYDSKKSQRAEITCKHCNRVGVYYVEVADARAKIEAFQKLTELTEGKSGTTDAEAAGVTIIIEQGWWPDGDNPAEG